LLQVEPYSPRQLACTPGALTSVLSNLIGNAAKYGGEGHRVPPRIQVRCKEAHGNLARIEVDDNGPGLPRGAETLVFEPFRRLSGTKQPGIGLGLATVKKIIEAYGGRVGVSSVAGEGCIFGSRFRQRRPRSRHRGTVPVLGAALSRQEHPHELASFVRGPRRLPVRRRLSAIRRPKRRAANGLHPGT